MNAAGSARLAQRKKNVARHRTHARPPTIAAAVICVQLAPLLVPA
jgi:hypothetical protein